MVVVALPVSHATGASVSPLPTCPAGEEKQAPRPGSTGDSAKICGRHEGKEAKRRHRVMVGGLQMQGFLLGYKERGKKAGCHRLGCSCTWVSGRRRVKSFDITWQVNDLKNTLSTST